VENNIRDIEERHRLETKDFQLACPHLDEDITKNVAGSFFCKRCKTVMPHNFEPRWEKEDRMAKIHHKILKLNLEILPTGQIKFKRGDAYHNKIMKEVISSIIDGDKEVMAELTKFFKESEGIELLVGDTILCG
jgi:hypothetical protein